MSPGLRLGAVAFAALLVGGETTARAEAVESGVTRLTWDEAIRRAVGRNPSAVIAAVEIERADALVREARAAWLPTLTGNGSNTRLDSARTFGGTVGTPASVWNGNLDLRVPIVAPLGWVGEAHARDNRAISETSAADVRRQVASAAGRAYLSTLLGHRQVVVAGRARETARVHADYTHERLARGLGNAVDAARAAQELRTSEVQLENAEAALVRAQSALAILVNEAALVDVIDDVPLAAAAPAATADAIEKRTDVRLLERRREATAHLRRDNWAFYAPTLLADVQAFQQTKTSLAPESGWQASLVLSLPLFDGGLRYGVQRERRALDEEASVALGGLQRQVSVEVRTALAVVGRADAALTSARAAVDDARAAAALADSAYRAGATTNIEVVDAERAARDAESQAAIAEDGTRQARLDLLIASGTFP